jgi:hypothetical protein
MDYTLRIPREMVAYYALIALSILSTLATAIYTAGISNGKRQILDAARESAYMAKGKA